MALEITYYTGADVETGVVLGGMISRARVVLTDNSESLGTVPTNAKVARITAEEECVVSNNGAATSDTNGQFLGGGHTVDMQTPITGVLYAMLIQ